jgi:hypothetical protein
MSTNVTRAPLLAKVFDDRRPDPRSAAGDEYALSARLGYCANRPLMVSCILVETLPIL